MTLLNAASAVHLGATPAKAVYLGATQVWAESAGDLAPIGEWEYIGLDFPGPSSGAAWQHKYGSSPRSQFRINSTDMLGNTFASWDDLAPGGLLTVRRKSDGLVLKWYPVNFGVSNENVYWCATEDHANDPYPFEPLRKNDIIELLVPSAVPRQPLVIQDAYTEILYNDGGDDTWAASGMILGPESPDRTVVVSVGVRNPGDSFITAVTVAGQPLTQDHEFHVNNGQNVMSFWSGSPSGVSGDIVVSFADGTIYSVGLAVYSSPSSVTFQGSHDERVASGSSVSVDVTTEPDETLLYEFVGNDQSSNLGNLTNPLYTESYYVGGGNARNRAGFLPSDGFVTTLAVEKANSGGVDNANSSMSVARYL